MESTQAVTNQRRLGYRVLLGFVVIVGLLVGWHLYLSFDLSNRVRSLQSASSGPHQELSISVNPLTNLVSMTIAMPPDLDRDNPFAALGSALGQAMIQAIGPGFIERELNTRARIECLAPRSEERSGVGRIIRAEGWAEHCWN